MINDRRNGVTPFAIQEMRAQPDGFELVFTTEVDPASAALPAFYTLKNLKVDGLRALSVHERRAVGVRSAAGAVLAPPDAYSTLNRIPGRP